MKKNTCCILICVLVLMIAAFAAGAAFSHFAWGYHYKVWDEKSEPFDNGKMTLRHVTEYVGWGFLETEKSVIELERDNGLHMTIYKAQLGFQESTPWVSQITTHHDELTWEDGIHRYRLLVEPLPEPPGH